MLSSCCHGELTSPRRHRITATISKTHFPIITKYILHRGTQPYGVSFYSIMRCGAACQCNRKAQDTKFRLIGDPDIAPLGNCPANMTL
jgi:hypothetical protein